ncbi:MAG: DUF5615 family PIN-like protein [Parafilimonas terrae]|nr:DUF5615 family PIN-like protein [Parafilimonas terrae]
MRLLFDENSSHRIPELSADAFPGSAQVRLLHLGRADKLETRNMARAEGFTPVSLDADFTELARVRGPPPKVVWLHCGYQPRSLVVDLLRRCAAVMMAFEADPEAACLELYRRRMVGSTMPRSCPTAPAQQWGPPV